MLFHVLFHTMPPTVVSDVCQCVPHPNHHQTLSWAVGPPSIHSAHCQSPTTPSLSACHTHQSIMLLPQLSFILFNVFFIVIILLTIERLRGCYGMHHLFAPIINTLCVCVRLLRHPVWPSFCFGALAVVLAVHHADVFHTRTPHLDSGCC